MWEEPRPERLRELDSDRSGSIEKSVLAWAVIFGHLSVDWVADEQPPAPEVIGQYWGNQQMRVPGNGGVRT
jgi:hypothetical protein